MQDQNKGTLMADGTGPLPSQKTSTLSHPFLPRKVVPIK
jgi:hypothetical protein